MGKIAEIKLVGQPIFKQIMNLVDKVDINGLIRKHESDYYYKSFKTRTHLFTRITEIENHELKVYPCYWFCSYS
jgi:hypothetical protein